jgi:hypothetical protein
MSQSELMASIAEVRAKQDKKMDGIREVRGALVLQKLNQTPTRIWPSAKRSAYGLPHPLIASRAGALLLAQFAS